jgi:hypothetical protein
MREMGEFSTAQLVARISAQSGAPRQQAAAFSDHILTQFMGSIEKIGPDRYRMKREKPNTTGDSINLLRGIANRYGAPPDDEYDWQNPEKTSPSSKS